MFGRGLRGLYCYGPDPDDGTELAAPHRGSTFTRLKCSSDRIMAVATCGLGCTKLQGRSFNPLNANVEGGSSYFSFKR